MNQKLLKQAIKDMEKQMEDCQKIINGLKKLIDPEITYPKKSNRFERDGTSNYEI